ncbi:MAG: polysaccharide biosynthesis C-terminal domain-containing protein [Pseudomonadota bacterium]
MQTRTVKFAEKLIPDALQAHLEPILHKTDQILAGSDENAVSQRMAMSVFIIRVASAAIAFFSQVLLARWMGTFEYGIFVAVWAGMIISSTLIGLGLPSAVVRFVAEYKERDEPGLVWGIVNGSMWLSLAAASFASAVGATLLYIYPQIITHYFVMPLFLGILCLPAFSIEGINDSTGRPFNWLKIAFLPTFIIRPLAILVLMGLAILIGFEATAVTAMSSAIIATYSTTIIQFLLLRSKLKKTVERKKSEYKFGYWLTVALPIFLVESFYVLVTQVDVLFVSWLTNPEETAVYFAATKILALVHFVYFAVRASVSHRFAAYSASGKIEEYRIFVRKTVSWTFWPSLALGIAMIVLGKYLLMLFGPEYVAGQSVLWILVAGIVMRASIGPAEALLVMSGKQNICAVVYGSALFVNVVLNITLIPLYGMIGAAIATAIALGFESVSLYAMVQRKLGIHAFILPLIRPSLNPLERGK